MVKEKSSNAKQGARWGQALSRMMVVDHKPAAYTHACVCVFWLKSGDKRARQGDSPRRPAGRGCGCAWLILAALWWRSSRAIMDGAVTLYYEQQLS